MTWGSWSARERWRRACCWPPDSWPDICWPCLAGMTLPALRYFIAAASASSSVCCVPDRRQRAVLPAGVKGGKQLKLWKPPCQLRPEPSSTRRIGSKLMPSTTSAPLKFLPSARVVISGRVDFPSPEGPAYHDCVRFLRHREGRLSTQHNGKSPYQC